MPVSSMRGSSNGSASGSSVWLAGTSAPMREVERALGHLAHANVNMVIHGEPGTGKRVLAERIHQQGPRSGEPVRRALAREASRSRGRAPALRRGWRRLGAERAARDRSTSTAVDLLPSRLQAQMALGARPAGLRPRRSGDRRNVGAARGADPARSVPSGSFFRLAVVRIALPRCASVARTSRVVADRVMGEWCEAAGAPRPGLSRLAVAELTSYAWPGNSRELEQTDRGGLGACHAARRSRRSASARSLGRRPRRVCGPTCSPLRQLERDYIAGVLSSCNWNQSPAARRPRHRAQHADAQDQDVRSGRTERSCGSTIGSARSRHRHDIAGASAIAPARALPVSPRSSEPSVSRAAAAMTVASATASRPKT